jgi:hypothetical protein
MGTIKKTIVIIILMTIVIALKSQAQLGGGTSTTYTLSGTYTLNGGSAAKTGETITSSTTDQSGVYVLNSGNLTLTNCIISTTGNSSSNDNSSFYGLNAAVLATSAGKISLTGCTISSTGSGANGVFAYGTASIISTGNKYTMTGGGGHAIMCSGGGTIVVNNDTAVTSGSSSSNIATDRGGGTIAVNGGSYTSNGGNSAAVYSTGTITCTNATLIANGAEALVIEGSNKIILNNCAVKCTCNKWGSLLYQSMSGDATGVDGYLTMTGGSFTYTGKAGGLFYNTNSTANYALSGVTINNSCDTLIRCIKGSWGGSSASSGGIANFIAKKQTLTGLIHVDANSRAHIILQDTSSFTGAINNSNTADTVTLTMDASSAWIVIKASYLTSIANSAGISGTTITNIIGNGNNVYYKPSATVNSYLGGKTYTLVNSGYLLPEGSSDVEEESSSVPAGWSLKQNYPNPFNPSTTISYQTPTAGHVILQVFDALGREVASLVNEEKQAGTYNIIFNAQNLPSGIYIYRITGINFAQSKKMFFIK